MTRSKRPRVVQTVFRDRSPGSVNGGPRLTEKEVERIANGRITALPGKVITGSTPGGTVALINDPRGKLQPQVRNLPVHNPTAKERRAAQVGHKKRVEPKNKPVQKRTVAPKAPKITVPAVYKKDDGKPLVERLNGVLLAQLQTRKVSNADAAKALGVNPSYLSRTVAKMQDKLPGATNAYRKARKKLSDARNNTRAMLAKSVNKGEMTFDKAVKQAKCSERTMFRWCAKYANLKKESA